MASIHSLIKITTIFVVLAAASGQLTKTFYDKTCPKALSTIKSGVRSAVSKEARMGASLLRLHFHDCFVNGCDASVLLDDTATFIGEKTAPPNFNSLRGFDVIDSIKSSLESLCPNVVSCADILAVAARDSVVALRGTGWDVVLGRRDSTTASFSAVTENLIAPTASLTELISGFGKKGFTTNELVALYGAHTIGQAKCATFRGRVYNESDIDPSFASEKQAICPAVGGDDNLSPFDTISPNKFDNGFFQDLVAKKGLLHSDQQLYSGGTTNAQVDKYVAQPVKFRKDFAKGMLKMGNLGPLTGTQGQIRRICSRVN